MTERRKELVLIALLTASTASCGNWGTTDDAKQVFQDHRSDLQEIVRTVQLHPEIRRVDPVFPADKNMELNPQYGHFSEDSKKAYRQILRLMQEAHIQTTVVERNGHDELIQLLVYARGIGPSTEGIDLVHFNERDHGISHYYPINSKCESVSKHWYVCKYS